MLLLYEQKLLTNKTRISFGFADLLRVWTQPCNMPHMQEPNRNEDQTVLDILDLVLLIDVIRAFYPFFSVYKWFESQIHVLLVFYAFYVIFLSIVRDFFFFFLIYLLMWILHKWASCAKMSQLCALQITTKSWSGMTPNLHFCYWNVSMCICMILFQPLIFSEKIII